MACTTHNATARFRASLSYRTPTAAAPNRRKFSAVVLALAGAISFALLSIGVTRAAAQTLPAVTITKIIQDTDSVKVQYAPVPGAVDYRIYDVSDPTMVKYAGVQHLQSPIDGSYIGDAPNLEIEWNGLVPGQTVTLVVEAVNALGPASECTLPNSSNGHMYPDAVDPTMPLGSDEGDTLDGNLSINGQGPVTDNPQAIARSAPFAATPSGLQALPSSPASTQVVFDNFASATITPVGTPNPATGSAQYKMVSDVPWDIFEQNADVADTSVFVMNRHFMDVLFDGGTPGSNNPLHVGHGALALSPQQTVDFSNGQILHMTMEVDSHLSDRRWVAFNIAPASSPLTNFDFATGALSPTNSALFVQVRTDGYASDLYGTDANGNPTDTPITGSLGQAPLAPWRQYNYIALDDRTRFDLFVSQTHFQLYENGVQVIDAAIPNGGLPFSDAKVYFSHYVYHTGLEEPTLEQYEPYEKFWINDMSFSDERHWDNMGYEVLPATTSWATTSTYVGNFTPTKDTGGSGTGGQTGSGTGSGGSGSGSGGSGSGSSGSGGNGQSIVVVGTVTNVTKGQFTPVYVTVATPNGTITLRTQIPLTAGLAAGCCTAKSTVTFHYKPLTGDPNAIGRISGMTIGS